MSKDKKITFYLILFTVIILIINIVQSLTTALHADEAYYWIYSQSLDWGYFDHPPLVALLIKIGYFIFQNELGVRLFSIIFSALSFVLLWKYFIFNEQKTLKDLVLFFLFYLSIPIFNIYAFITTPDSALLFFSILFLIIYKKLLDNSSLKMSLILGFIVALLLYSKYHSVLLFFFVIISDFKVLKNKYIWITFVFAFVLFIPHLLWQYFNDFPTIRYHIDGRNTGFAIKNFGEFIINFFLIFNPILVFIYVKKYFFSKEKSSKNYLDSIFWGVLFFFFITTYKGHSEPHWLAIAAIPFTIIFFNRILPLVKQKKLVLYIFLFSTILLLIVRIMIPFDNIKLKLNLNRKKMKELSVKCEKNPVVFINSYKAAALYTFYTGIKSISDNNAFGRLNHYDLKDYESQFYNQKVFLIYNYTLQNGNTFVFSDSSKMYYKIVNNYMPTNKLEVTISKNNHIFTNDTTNYIEFTIYNPYPFDLYNNNDNKIGASIVFYQKEGHSLDYRLIAEFPDTLKSLDSVKIYAKFNLKEIKCRKHKFKIGVTINSTLPSNNSIYYDYEIKD